MIVLSKSIFAGEVVSDTGPLLKWNKFKQFPMKYLFRQVTASSHCTQANRLVENGVKILTHLLKKGEKSSSHAYLALPPQGAAPVVPGSASADILFTGKPRPRCPALPGTGLRSTQRCTTAMVLRPGGRTLVSPPSLSRGT